MDTNGVTLEPEIQIEQDDSNSIPQEEEELQIIYDGSNPYKKVKLNMEGGPKKKAPEVLEISSDEEDITVEGHGKKREKGAKSGEGMRYLSFERIMCEDEGDGEKKKKKKKSKKKEKDEDDEDDEEKKERKKSKE